MSETLLGDLYECSSSSGDRGVAWWDMGGTAVWDWGVGTLGEWVTAAVALIAVVFAWLAASRSNRLSAQLLEVEKAREDRTEALEKIRRNEAARAVQADHVASWVSPADDESDSVVRVHNSSALPIYDVTVKLIRPQPVVPDVRRATRPAPEVHFRLVPPGGEVAKFPTDELGQVTIMVKNSVTGIGLPATVEETPMLYRTSIEFSDVAGRSWRRDEKGLLSGGEIDRWPASQRGRS